MLFVFIFKCPLWGNAEYFQTHNISCSAIEAIEEFICCFKIGISLLCQDSCCKTAAHSKKHDLKVKD